MAYFDLPSKRLLKATTYPPFRGPCSVSLPINQVRYSGSLVRIKHSGNLRKLLYSSSGFNFIPLSDKYPCASKNGSCSAPSNSTIRTLRYRCCDGRRSLRIPEKIKGHPLRVSFSYSRTIPSPVMPGRGSFYLLNPWIFIRASLSLS